MRRQYEHKILDIATDGWWDWDLKADKVYLSSGYCQLIGYTPDERESNAAFLWSRVHPDDHEYVRTSLQELLAGKQELSFTEHRITAIDGAVYWILGKAGVAEYDEQGNVSRMVGSIINITERKKAEQKSQDGKQLYETLFRLSPEIIALTSERDGRYIAVNSAHEQATGYSADELIGHTSTELNIWREPAERQHAIDQLQEQGTVHSAEVHFCHRSGEEFPALLSMARVDMEGEPCLISVVTDITARKRTEESLRGSEERYRRLFENMMEGFAYCRMLFTDGRPDDFIYLEVNDAFTAMTGLKNVVGRKVSEIIPGIKESDPDLFEICGRVATTGQPEQFEMYLEALSMWFSVSVYSPHREHFVAVFDVITERKQADLKLRESEEKFRLIFEGTADAIFWADPETGILLNCNRAAEKMLGTPRSDIIGRHQTSLHPPELLEEYAAIFKKAVADPIAFPSVEALVLSKNGRRIPVEIMHSVIRLGDRMVIQGVFRDITERRMMQDELIKSQKLESLGVLAGGIAHDFNNILTGIMGNISLARLLIDKPNKAAPLLQQAEKATERASDLASQLLTFAKGGQPIKKAVAVKDLVEACASLVLRGSSVGSVLDLPDNLHHIDADEGQISQAFNNVIINAAQAMAGGGAIIIHAKNISLEAENKMSLPPGEYVKFTFIDTGGGMPSEVQKRIFEPYFTTKAGGTGLGLASAYSIITKHGGRIEVSSQVGQGTTFEIVLPASEGEIQWAKADRAVLALREQKRRSLLVMDDEEMIREVASAMLRELGYQVQTCASGEEAIEMYKSAQEAGTPFSAVIMDLTIPGGMGGKEAAQQILDLAPGSRLIVSSGYSNDPVMANPHLFGFCATIVKPYTIITLEEVLRGVFASES